MNKIRPPRGLIVNLALPAGDKPEAGDFVRLLNLVCGNVDGILIDPLYWAPTSDIASYQCRFLERCIEVVPANLPLFVMITGFDEEETRGIFDCVKEVAGNIKKERKIFLVDLPLSYHSNRGLPDYYRDLLSDTDLPLLVMNDPKRVHFSKPFFKRKNLIPAVLRKLADVPNICGLINVTDLKRSLSYSWALRDRSDFRIYDGRESLFLENPNKGGLVSITANLFPSSWKLVVKSSLGIEDVSCVPDMIKERWYVGRFLQEVTKEIEDHAPLFIKYVLNYWGVFRDPPGSYPDSHFEAKALHFVRSHPEPDRIHPL
ncbi:MAG: hypothetical protein DRG59_03920 [Deltaproteobacteria bacterium]|nr:MAG: hypothetical protein DRG59_03920 [Deltaproteobacteria bacterium]HEC31490.1 hypothetical protein [Deltaproteobacteria bacterium]